MSKGMGFCDGLRHVRAVGPNAAQENTLKGFSGEAKNCKERVNHNEEEENLERMKYETSEALSLM
jgi:hypothetical protein